MTAHLGLLGNLTRAQEVQDEIGCTFEQALEIVAAADGYDEHVEVHNTKRGVRLLTVGNVIYGGDFINKVPREKINGTL